MITFLFYYSLLSLAFFFALKLLLQNKKFTNIPPGPPSLPILGNLHQLEKPLHQALHRISQSYGEVFSLWFGSRLFVIVSSQSAVQECFTKNDIVLANRPRFLIGEYVAYNCTTLTLAPYGDHWRNLRRVTALEVLSNYRLNKFLEMRREEVKRLVQKLAQESVHKDQFLKVEMKSRFSELTFNIIMRMISGKRYWGDDNEVGDVEEARKIRQIIKELVSLGGVNNSADFLPILWWFDFGHLEKKLKGLAKRADGFSQGLIDEHRRAKQRANTMIDHLLSLQESQPEYYTDQIIKGLILVMVFAGTDTSSVTLEWAMSSLLNNPHVLEKAKKEIDTHIGQERLIDEPEISKLPYLQNIVSETLRLHPALPLLIAHEASNDCTISGYNVPRGTIVLINAWANHRDPQLWSDPTSFKPERFEKEGEANKLITFGLGRRACPGESLAQRTVSLTLGLLIQCFEWKRVSEEEIDMTEGAGATMPKVIPLEAMCRARHPIINMLLS
ncbi:cytochrome P450 81E8-like [Neltuma alba]|uniref:cytochrome P450 81E8-like n=1 Tax=Neltuma alba TaxID=207710 RepID=UPI0010A48265|nr:cytochrome P450 81E8-like [Prosopis alba]XP_028769514.1 cytochrome P450 81E8-like [Prosopis alba]XP_028779067.1 cytochrome P450 81E8-like [Prosopis alba]